MRTHACDATVADTHGNWRGENIAPALNAIMYIDQTARTANF